jgi:hypothetical protein
VPLGFPDPLPHPPSAQQDFRLACVDGGLGSGWGWAGSPPNHLFTHPRGIDCLRAGGRARNLSRIGHPSPPLARPPRLPTMLEAVKVQPSLEPFSSIGFRPVLQSSSRAGGKTVVTLHSHPTAAKDGWISCLQQSSTPTGLLVAMPRSLQRLSCRGFQHHDGEGAKLAGIGRPRLGLHLHNVGGFIDRAHDRNHHAVANRRQ